MKLSPSFPSSFGSSPVSDTFQQQEATEVDQVYQSTHWSLPSPQEKQRHQTHIVRFHTSSSSSSSSSPSSAGWKFQFHSVVLLLVVGTQVTMTRAKTMKNYRFISDEEEKLADRLEQDERWHKQSSCSFRSFLSELAFSRDAPSVDSKPPALARLTSKRTGSTASSKDSSPSPSVPTIWQSLFCMAPDERDVYYDAYEIIDSSSKRVIPNAKDKIAKHPMKPSIFTASQTLATLKVRGGEQHADGAFEPRDFPRSPPPPTQCHWDYGGPASPAGQYSAQCKYEQRLDQYERYCQGSPKSQFSLDQAEQKEHDDQSFEERQQFDRAFTRTPPPPPPIETPLRFLRAAKGDPLEGKRRYEATLKWRRDNGMDDVMMEAFPHFETIKKHYPHYFHLRARQGEPVYYEKPPQTNLAALRKAGVDLETLLHHYAMITEFQWQFIERDDFARSITVIDLKGMRMTDFVGDCVEFVKKCSQFTGQHYPERAGTVFVVNVPGWFKMIWNVVKPMVDEVTLEKIKILRGQEEIFRELQNRIPVENIPPEYGGKSMPLGQSPQEALLRDLMLHNNNLSAGNFSCGGCTASPPCRFCSWTPARCY